MAIEWLPISTIPKTGMTVSYGEDDTALWQEKLKETSLSCTFNKPIEAEITLQVDSEGIVVSGNFTAEIIVPCSFCLEPAYIQVGHIFYDLIQTEESLLLEEGKYLQETKKGLEVDIAEIIFEEFLIDASVSAECKKGCLGLCATCGINKNHDTCSCDANKKDPRLEKLHALVLEKKK